MFVTISSRARNSLARPLASPKTPRFNFSRPNIPICLSPFAHTCAKSDVTLSLPTHTKMALRKSFTCHTYEKAGGCPQGFVAIKDGVLFRELFSGRVAQQDRVGFDVPPLDGQFAPSGENRNLMDSFPWEMRELPRGELSSGCSKDYPRPFLAPTYQRSLGLARRPGALKPVGPAMIVRLLKKNLGRCNRQD